MEQERIAKGDLEFARHFEDFVNGYMSSAEKTGKAMAEAHRYLQSQMFNVCLAYIRQLAENYRKGYYDPRNERAARLSAVAYEALIDADEVYDPKYDISKAVH
ncbi:MAG: sulfide:quinone reductase [Bacteroidales bacterium]|nr:sulfide:quinone reductase [Bacteroidales bacterium]